MAELWYLHTIFPGKWYCDTVRVSVDRAGRMVIPKPFRAALGLHGEAEVDVVADGSGLRIEPVGSVERPVDHEDGLPLLRRVGNLVVTDTEVQRLRDEAAR